MKEADDDQAPINKDVFRDHTTFPVYHNPTLGEFKDSIVKKVIDIIDKRTKACEEINNNMEGLIMSTYYYLLNDTKKLCIHFDNLVKEEPVTLYSFIQMAFINYMYENQGDKFRFVSEHYDETVDYKSLDLLTYNFEGYGIKEKIMRKYQRYIRSL